MRPSSNLRPSSTMRPSQLHVNAIFPFVLLFATFKSTLGFEGCNICADGSTITKPDYFLGGFINISCQAYSDESLSIDADSDSCDRSRFFAGECGCPVLLDPCTLCWDGSSITNPDNDVDIYGDGREVYTCQQWNDGLEGLPNDSRSCHRARSGFGVTCGCPVYGDPCTICKGGALMDKPEKEFVVTVGAEAIRELFLDDATKLFTCGSAETALSALTNRVTASVIGINCCMDRPVGVLIIQK